MRAPFERCRAILRGQVKGREGIAIVHADNPGLCSTLARNDRVSTKLCCVAEIRAGQETVGGEYRSDFEGKSRFEGKFTLEEIKILREIRNLILLF